MQKLNILKRLYKHAPMNFYSFSDNSTTIKSINNTSLGYKFDRIFTNDEINMVWKKIKIYKRISTIMIFLSFIVLLYSYIFPNFYMLIDQNLYIITSLFIAIIFFIYLIITFINTKCFETQIKKIFGAFEKTIFKPSNSIDEKYYKLFKLELVKAFTILVVIGMCFQIGSPFKLALKLINQEKYASAIKITTIGSKIFPIASEWYSLRGYSRFQLKNYQGAIEDYHKAYKLGPDEFNVINFDNKIFIKYYLKDYDGAIKDFDEELQNASDEFEKDSFLWDKAQFLYNIKKYNEALEIYNDLLIKAETDQIYLLKNRLYFERAQVYKELGQDELAEEDLENAELLSIEDSFKNPIPEPSLLLNEL